MESRSNKKEIFGRKNFIQKCLINYSFDYNMTVYTEKFLLQPAGLNLDAKSWLVYKTDQFVGSCFGDYMNMWMGVECLPLLYHYHMCNEFTTFDPFDLEELLFPIGDYQVCFDIKIFTLSPACGSSSISPIAGVFGKYLRKSVTNKCMALVSNLDELNRYKTFPNSSIVGSPMLGVFPWTDAYPRMRHLHAVECECICNNVKFQLNF
uniref:Uncharacterized protein n=1 Tax=Lactuca sativa TaxID=4236 RepID=A0A9R1WPQ0_LACSA|nr:hypothetical protein LSAT_V11C100037850 [Lactuca sativa]